MACQEPGLAAVFSPLCSSSPGPKRARLPGVRILGGLFYSPEYCASALNDLVSPFQHQASAERGSPGQKWLQV